MNEERTLGPVGTPYETDLFRLTWHDRGDVVNGGPVLRLVAEERQGDNFKPMTPEPELSVFSAEAGEAFQRGALVAFAEQLAETVPHGRAAMLKTLLWTELTDRAMLQNALAHIAPAEFGDALYKLFGLEPRAGFRAAQMGSDEQLAALTEDHVVRLVRHENPEARSDALRALRTESSRLTGLNAPKEPAQEAPGRSR